MENKTREELKQIVHDLRCQIAKLEIDRLMPADVVKERDDNERRSINRDGLWIENLELHREKKALKAENGRLERGYECLVKERDELKGKLAATTDTKWALHKENERLREALEQIRDDTMDPSGWADLALQQPKQPAQEKTDDVCGCGHYRTRHEIDGCTGYACYCKEFKISYMETARRRGLKQPAQEPAKIDLAPGDLQTLENQLGRMCADTLALTERVEALEKR